MLSKATAKYVRMSPRKARLVIDLIKGKTVEEATNILEHTNKGACVAIRKVLVSAFANANNERQEKLLSKDMFISVIKADGGPMLTRFRAATMGRATPIRHRTAHIHIELDQVEADKTKKKKAGSK